MNIPTPARFGGNHVFFEKMVRKFIADFLSEPWPPFDDAVKDADKLKSLVHTVKGTSGNLDLKNIYEAAVAFEESLRGGSPNAELYKNLTDACDALIKDAG